MGVIFFMKLIDDYENRFSFYNFSTFNHLLVFSGRYHWYLEFEWTLINPDRIGWFHLDEFSIHNTRTRDLNQGKRKLRIILITQKYVQLIIVHGM